MKQRLIKYIEELEANHGLPLFVEAYKDKNNPYFRAINVLKKRYGYSFK